MVYTATYLHMIKKIFPLTFKEKIKLSLRRFKIYTRSRIFCISMQKTGTTSVGDFFEYFGYPVARWHDSDRLSWSNLWFEGNFEKIFSSIEFQSFQVFEDNPWWFPEFYKVLYHRFPNAKFILFTRDPDEWFRSMKASFHGDSNDVFKIHAKIYRREKQFYEIVDNHQGGSPITWQQEFSLEGMRPHYKMIYETRNREVLDFFKRFDPDSLLHCELNDENKWMKIGNFIGIDVPKNFKIHSNKTHVRVTDH